MSEIVRIAYQTVLLYLIKSQTIIVFKTFNSTYKNIFFIPVDYFEK